MNSRADDPTLVAPSDSDTGSSVSDGQQSGVVDRVIGRIESTGTLANDTREVRVRKGILTLSTVLISVAGVIWGAIYLWLGISLAAIPPLAYSALSVLSFGVFARVRHFGAFRSTQLLLILLLPFSVHIVLGGYAASSNVALWALLAPLGALMFAGPREGIGWFLAFTAINLFAGFAEPSLVPLGKGTLTPAWRSAFSVMNAVAPTTIAFWMLLYYVRGDQRLRRVIARKDREIDAARKVGSYTLEALLGQGGMGAVYLAKHALLRRPTAVKLIDAERAGAALIERFEREVQATSELSHPNVIEVYDYGKSPDGNFYYAMEYLPGLDLEDLVRRSGPLPVARAINVLRQAAEALCEAHARGLVHRDIKPANMILSQMGTRSDVLKVLDFGLVKSTVTSAPAGVTEENTISGTPSYLSPEAIESPQLVGPASDVYALGCVAYYLLTGAPPFSASSNARLWVAHLNEPPVPLSLRNELVPRTLEEFVSKCLSKDPALRYANGGELRDALAEIAAAHPWSAEEARECWRVVGPEKAPRPSAPPTAPTLAPASRVPAASD